MIQVVETEVKYEYPDQPPPSDFVEVCCQAIDPAPCSKIPGYKRSVLYAAEAPQVEDDGEYPIEYRAVNVPKNGICGEQYETWEWNAKGCCDGVEPLAYNNAKSGDVIVNAANPVLIVCDGGKGPYLWKVGGHPDFQFSNKQKQILTATPWVWLYGTASCCGYAPVYCEDACKQKAEGVVRGVLGVWKEKYRLLDNTPIYWDCLLNLSFSEYKYAECGGGECWASKYEAQWKYTSNVQWACFPAYSAEVLSWNCTKTSKYPGLCDPVPPASPPCTKTGYMTYTYNWCTKWIRAWSAYLWVCPDEVVTLEYY